MDSFKAFDAVVEYIENCIADGCELDFECISKIAVCPAPLFQRIFVFVAGVTVTEYLRRRRLTLAGYDVKQTGDKIIDIAVRYGFNSHAAFTRAFREYHSVSPSDVRNNGARLKEFLPIRFKNIRIIGGKRIMADLRKIEYADFGARKVVGISKLTSFQKAGEECWGAAVESGVFDKLQEIDGYVCDDIDAYFGLGHMSEFTSRDDFRYIVGKFVHCDAPVPEGMCSENVPAGPAAKICVEGDTLNDIIDCAYLICSEAIEKTGYKIDPENFYWCDVYTYERYTEPLNRGEKIAVDYLLPVIKA